MIYFSSQPVAPQSIDANQFAELQAFKEKLKPRGLVESFDNPRQFKEKFAKQLQLCLINNRYLQGLVREQPDDQAIAVANSHEVGQKLSLTNEARILLKAAAQKEDGTILKIAYMGGRVIQAGGQQFGGERGREAAKWENALNELIENGLVVARGYKDEVFDLTHQGWSVADAL